MKKIQVFVISWNGMHDKAEAIAQAIHPVVDRVSVIYSNKDETEEMGTGHWEQVSNEYYFGRKFKRALDLFTGDIFVLIQADAYHENWPQVLRRCAGSFGIPELGVWAPNVDWSWWTTERVKLGNYGKTGLSMVAQTDGIIFALRSDVADRIRGLDYECNNLGWGIEWAAIAYAYSHDLLVLRDETITVNHPKGSGYDHSAAREQQNDFLSRLTPQERIMYALLNRVSSR